MSADNDLQISINPLNLTLVLHVRVVIPVFPTVVVVVIDAVADWFYWYCINIAISLFFI